MGVLKGERRVVRQQLIFDGLQLNEIILLVRFCSCVLCERKI